MSTNRDNDIKFFREFATQLAISINVAQLGRVVSVSADKRRQTFSQWLLINQVLNAVCYSMSQLRATCNKNKTRGESSYLDQ